MTIDPAMDERPIEPDYSDETSTFGDRLVLARESLGLSQAQLARRIGVRSQTCRNWEEDRSEPRANSLQMLAGLLNVSMAWLMSGMGEAPDGGLDPDAPSDGEIAAVLADLRALRGEQARMAERMARIEKRLRAALVA